MDWIPIAISGLSLLLSAYAVFRSIRYTRSEPFWAAEVTHAGDTTRGGRVAEVSFRNSGDGVGYEVKLESVRECGLRSDAASDAQVEPGARTSGTKVWIDGADWSRAQVLITWTRKPTYLRKRGRQWVPLLEAVREHERDSPRAAVTASRPGRTGWRKFLP